MTRIPRYDVFEVKLSSLKEDSSTGWLRGHAFLTSSDVYPYLDQNGKFVYEARLPEDVFDTKSMTSAKMLPVTNEHPFEQLTKENTAKYQVGNLGSEIKKHEDGLRLYSEIIITDAKTIKDIKDKKRIEISMGYTVYLKKEDGVYRNKTYSHRHTNIEYNHAAITTKGRAGKTVGLVTDSVINSNKYRFDSEFNIINNKTPKGNRMDEEIVINGETIKVPKAVADAYKGLESSLTASKAKTDSADGALKKVSDELEVSKANSDRLKNELEEAKKVDHSAEVKKRVDARRSLEVKAQKILGDDFKTVIDSDDRDLKIAMIKKVNPSFEAKDDTTELYLDTYLEGALATIDGKHVSNFNKDSSDPAPKGGSLVDSLEKARNDTQAAQDKLDEETYSFTPINNVTGGK